MGFPVLLSLRWIGGTGWYGNDLMMILVCISIGNRLIRLLQRYRGQLTGFTLTAITRSRLSVPTYYSHGDKRRMKE
jgi:hypothetical protein